MGREGQVSHFPSTQTTGAQSLLLTRHANKAHCQMPWQLAMRRQVTALRAVNSGLSQARVNITSLITSTASHMST